MIVFYVWSVTVILLTIAFIYTMWKMHQDSWMTKEEDNEESRI
jgi:hypothetical protein